MAKTSQGIDVIAVTHAEVMALLESEALKKLETEIAKCRRIRVLPCDSPVSQNLVKAEVSICGLTPNELEQYMLNKHNEIVEFVMLTTGELDDDAEYPKGEEQVSDRETVEVRNFGSGFGLTHAIYHHFLSQRTPEELRAFLKNRRIPRHNKFAKELETVFAEMHEK